MLSPFNILMILFVYFTRSTVPLYFLTILINSRHPNIRFTMGKDVNHKLHFLDVLIDNYNSNFFLTRVNRKKTFTGPLTNCFSFTTYFYYKINNTWSGFHEDLIKLIDVLKRIFFLLIWKGYKSWHSCDPKQSFYPGFPSHHFTY